MTDRTLGDVPGIDDLMPTSYALPGGYTYPEINSLGDITAGGALDGMSGADPFSYSAGFLDEPQDAAMAPGHTAVHDPMKSSHLPSYDGSSETSTSSSSSTGTATGGDTQWDQEQLDNARTIAKVGKRVGASDRDIQIAISVAIVESNVRNLDHGDRDSIGMFQQRDAWGSREERLDPAKSAEMFFLGGKGGQRGLLDISDRDKMSMGEAAQTVQVSAYPDRYAEHENDAAALMGVVSGDTKTHGTHGNDPYALTERDGATVDNLTAAALDAAGKEFGGDLRIMQGSHSDAVAASGGTHSGGGVIDVEPVNGDWEGALVALRKIGFAAWIRNRPGYGQAGSGAHIHAVLIGNKELSPEAEQQVQSYLNNDDGLAGSRADDGPRQYIHNRFVWGEAKSKPNVPTWRDAVVKEARGYVGTPFQWGGKDHSGVDDEGMLHSVYSKIGLDLPPMGHDLRALTEPVAIAEAKPGDLIGWHDPKEGSRYGIFLGNGRLIEAGGPGRVVQVSEMGAAALNTFGIPIQELLHTRRVVHHAAPGVTPTPHAQYSTFTNPGTVSVNTNPSTGHSMVEPHASIPAPDPHGPLTPGVGANNPNHPHAPLPGEF